MIRARLLANLRGRRGGAARISPSATQPGYPQVEIYSWRRGDGTINFGDHLAEIVASRILALNARHPQDEVARARRLFTIGSVLHFAQDGDAVWGSGVNGKIAAERHVFGQLDVRAVRGPRTAAFLRERGVSVPAVYGDPALLLPHLFGSRFSPDPRREVVFVPNLNDLGAVETSVPTISPLRGWNYVIARILEAELVLASSLHGLVVAEAYGIPARYVRLTEEESLFKYEDYVLGSGREALEFATSIPEALRMGGMPPPRWDPQPLLAAFPLDLWDQPPE